MRTLLFHFIFLTILPILVLTSGFNFFRAKTIKLDRFTGRCSEYPNAIVTFEKVRLMKSNRIYTLNLQITARDTINNDMNVEIIGFRCKSKDSPDTCEQYKTIKLRKLCDLLNRDNQPWTPFMNKIQPKLECPLRKGIYQVRNGTFDGNAFGNLPIEDWYWKVISKTREDVTNRVIICIQIEAQIIPI